MGVTIYSLAPWEALPVGQTERNRRIEMTTRGWGAYDDSKGNAESKGKTNLEEA